MTNRLLCLLNGIQVYLVVLGNASEPLTNWTLFKWIMILYWVLPFTWLPVVWWFVIQRVLKILQNHPILERNNEEYVSLALSQKLDTIYTFSPVLVCCIGEWKILFYPISVAYTAWVSVYHSFKLFFAFPVRVQDTQLKYNYFII